MQTIEYKVIEHRNPGDLGSNMNKLASEGWIPSCNPTVTQKNDGTMSYLVIMGKAVAPKPEKK